MQVYPSLVSAYRSILTVACSGKTSQARIRASQKLKEPVFAIFNVENTANRRSRMNYEVL